MTGPEHDFQWTEQAIGEFWDEVLNEDRIQHLYFTEHHAEDLIEFAEWAGLSPKDRVLDYGAGKGFLSAALLEEGHNVTALEFSEQSYRHCNQELGGRAGWNGCEFAVDLPTPLPSDSFDFIFSVETYEHLLEEWIDPYLGELYRVLAPGGKLFISTPCNEHLDDSLMICPACKTRFHRWGHLRSIGTDDMFARVKAAGFLVECCQGINFADVRQRPWQRDWRDLSMRMIGKWMQAQAVRVRGRDRHQPLRKLHRVRTLPPGPHMVMVARKPADDSADAGG